MLQSWLSSCLIQILVTSGGLDQIDYVPTSSLSTYHNVFRAVVAAHGGSPPDDVIDAVIDCARRRSSLSRRRRRRQGSWQTERGCRCRRRVAVVPWRPPRTSPGDGRMPHLEGVHHEDAHLHRRRSITECGKICH